MLTCEKSSEFLLELKRRYGPHGMFLKSEAESLGREWPGWKNHLDVLIEHGRVAVTSVGLRIV